MHTGDDREKERERSSSLRTSFFPLSMKQYDRTLVHSIEA